MINENQIQDSDLNLLFKKNDIKSIVYFKEDSTLRKYNKLCMIKIVDQELLVSYIGIENYFIHLKSAVSKITTYLDKNDNSDLLAAYVIDGATFIVACNDDITNELFVEIMQDIHNRFHYIKSDYTKISILARFAIIINNENLLECAFAELNNAYKSHLDLIINNNKNIDHSDINQELEMINIIQWAISNNKVIPYYQGIFDIKANKINRYEALMRIEDINGQIHGPFNFLNIAKKYHMYTKLSELMIKRVFKDIDKYKLSTSINLSAIDINSTSCREMFYKLLNKYDFKNMLAIEIVEDETFDDSTCIEDFIANVKSMGVKIAIDDFGSGYSNLLKIIQLEPDYIKIDGSIIKNLNNNQVNEDAFETIMFLANKIGAKTIGEYVEDESLAQVLKHNKVDLLQGYYYSKPQPIENIINSIDQNIGE